MRRALPGLLASSMVASTTLGCGELLVEELPCEPSCVSDRSIIVCNENGSVSELACPDPVEECGRGACQAGACTFEPVAGKACANGGSCNAAGVCVGPAMTLSALLKQTCAIVQDGTLWCWGNNQWAQLGDGTTQFRSAATLVRGLPPGKPVTAVGVGYAHVCAIAEGKVYCWGNNEGGQCGSPPQPFFKGPQLVTLPGVEFVSVSAGFAHSCALSTQRTVYCWGLNDEGQCGVDKLQNGEVVRSQSPVQVPGLSDVIALGSIKSHNCALASSKLWCWGRNAWGQLGVAPAQMSSTFTPIELAVDGSITGFGLGFDSTYVRTAQPWELFAVGYNHRGQLGIGSDQFLVTTPTRVVFSGIEPAPLQAVVDTFRSDGSHQCADIDGALYSARYLCWGGNDYGELGLGEAATGQVFTAAQRAIALPAFSRGLVFGEDHGCVIDTSDLDEVQCFGKGEHTGTGIPSPGPMTASSQVLNPTPISWDVTFTPAHSR